MVAYHLNVRDIYANYDVDCMANQLTNSEELTGFMAEHGDGDTCTRRWTEEDSPEVCMGPDAREQGLCEGIPDADATARVASGTRKPRPVVDGKPVGLSVDEAANGTKIQIKSNKGSDLEKQKALEKMEAERWRQTLIKAGYIKE